jgi:phytoene/squalene synthetase
MTSNSMVDVAPATESRSSASSLGASITRSASRQTFYTIRFLVDRDRVQDAYRAYAYFRWVDDSLDQGGMDKSSRLAFIRHQETIIEDCFHGIAPRSTTREEAMLVDLVHRERERDSGLQAYIRNMLAVMTFDAGRQGELISGWELNHYTHTLAVAVTEAMHYFIGHRCKSPQTEIRYLAVSAAHVTHMLRDTLDDIRLGYYNIPRELVEAHKIDPCDPGSEPYRDWIRSRVELARSWFHAGREYLSRVPNPRCRLAGLAYSLRFNSILDAIEMDDYHLRPAYSERSSFSTRLMNGLSVLAQAASYRPPDHPLQAPLGE